MMLDGGEQFERHTDGRFNKGGQSSVKNSAMPTPPHSQ